MLRSRIGETKEKQKKSIKPNANKKKKINNNGEKQNI